MANFRNALPASLRLPVEKSKFASGLSAQGGRMTMLYRSDSPDRADDSDASGETVATDKGKDRFARLPQEPDDAKITGLTRSLTRRLMGLNMPKVMVVTVAKIA